MPFTTTTVFATSARARLDGIDIGALQDEGGGVFSGAVAIYGAVDNGAHVLEIIAEREAVSDHRPVPFEVNTPAAGTVAWAVPGPAGSRTRRNALTAERDVIGLPHAWRRHRGPQPQPGQVPSGLATMMCESKVGKVASIVARNAGRLARS
ncbi:MAG: hypothetical protein IPG88_13070 [Gemmatimonadetes bacterium]|nr:hypothetical protein [Gemmatimonadota bacterium]